MSIIKNLFVSRFLFENYLNFFGDIEDVVKVSMDF